LTFYANKKVFISGGSSGIGFAMASQIVEEGGTVFICGRTLSRLTEAKEKLERIHPSRVCILALDVADEHAYTPDVVRLLTDYNCDILIHSAGVGGASSFADTSYNRFRAVMDTNFFGAVLLTKVFFPSIAPKSEGRLCYISSIAGVVGIYGFTAYSASKFALDGFSQALRNELSEHSAKLTVIYPPDTDTPMLQKESANKPAATKALSSGNVLSAEQVARDALSGLALGEFQVFPGTKTKFLSFALRHFPSVVRYVCDRAVRKSLSTRP
jgi:3-dehydrosphinganine reductase